MITTLRRSTIALLASSLLFDYRPRGPLPFMTIYLTRRFQLEVDVIGYALSLALGGWGVVQHGFWHPR
ncbi:putative MFS-type transporter YdeE [Klebsiella pneumoniae subsp. pneumoniae]|uniref:Putative MFS-type transporter YdeE n=1 Tax=Klebsiella pneumoniae subsp. pneumoniae TaxID=72407 RepID=A0A377ZRG2_KLEPN|nr:putative MFS-type transporter YdeE [Klebsiella pneumoniae subsp. pneumoniae]